MREGFAVSGGYAYIKILCNCAEIFFRGCGEVPMEKFLVGVVAGVGSAVAAQNFGRVVGGIKADAVEEGGFRADLLQGRRREPYRHRQSCGSCAGKSRRVGSGYR